MSFLIANEWLFPVLILLCLAVVLKIGANLFNEELEEENE